MIRIGALGTIITLRMVAGTGPSSDSRSELSCRLRLLYYVRRIEYAQDKPSSGRAGLDIADVNRCNRADRADREWLVLLPRRGRLVVLLGRDRRVGSGPWDAACD